MKAIGGSDVCETCAAHVIAIGDLEAEIQALAAELADHKEVLDDKRRLTRELDVLLNGAGAAKQASLCDIVGQVRRENIRSAQFTAETKGDDHG